ncbi:M56 family metallopeptidase [Thalassotalea sediminis]|uniref:M56 family metallopeptidase n=1 Tax=Thalassotalea sediminis TaxID=1759089 RepID=UPI002572E628|nr:M56 family metallopeptidase [Thalassotalea sediminis]
MDSIENSAELYYIALTLIHFLWQGGLIALLLKFGLTLTSYKHANARYLLSTFAMVACLIMPIVTFLTIYQPDISPSSLLQNAVPLMESGDSFLSANKNSWHQDLLGSLPMLSVLWLITVSGLALKLFIELYQVNQIPKKDVIPPSDALTRTFDQLVDRMKLTRKPKLLIALKVDVPMAIGWLRPVVLIPASMVTGLTPAQLNMLMLHELAHIRRHDYLVNLLQTLVETLLFFNPAVRWISTQMRHEREYCSDDIAVSMSGDAFAYAHTLADTASLCHKHRNHAIPTMAMAASGGDLKKRVLRLVDQHHCGNTDESGKFLASVLIIVSVLAVALKPYLKMPIIDLSSGYISFATATEPSNSTKLNDADLSEASIANLLIQQDQTKAKLIVPDVELPQANSNQESSLALKNDLSIKQAVENDVDKSIAIQEQKLNSRISEPVNKPEVTLTKSSAIVSELEKVTKTEDDNQTILPQVGKSTSEIAFDRTDSANKSSRLDNPYSKQVAALSHSPDLLSEKDDAQAFQLPKPRAAALVLNTEKQPVAADLTPPPTHSKALIIVSPDPRYPSSAKRKGLELDVKVHFTIDNTGRVRNIEFEKKSRVSYFKSTIRNAMEKWRFQPAKLNGKPIESQMSKIFSFSLTE